LFRGIAFANTPVGVLEVIENHSQGCQDVIVHRFNNHREGAFVLAGVVINSERLRRTYFWSI